MSKNYQKGNSCVSNHHSVIYPKTKQLRRNRRDRFSFRRFCRFLYLRIVRFRGKPRILSRGLAVGVFAGFFPLFGLQIFIGVFLATLVRGNKFAAAAGTWVSNPLTYVPIYLLNFKVGKFLLGVESQPIAQLDLQSFTKFIELGSTFAITLMFGSFVVGSISALVTYFVSLHLLQKKHRKRR